MSGGRYGKHGELQRIRRLHPRGKPGGRVLPRTVSPPPQPRVQGPRIQRLSIRPAQPSDADFIHRLSALAFRTYGSYEDILREWLNSGLAFALIARIGGCPQGFAMTERVAALSDTSPRAVELLAIAVERSTRQKGAGRALLERIEAAVQHQGADLMRLHTATDNRPARCLFERSGYRGVRLKRNFYPKGQDALLMVKRLHPPSA